MASETELNKLAGFQQSGQRKERKEKTDSLEERDTLKEQHTVQFGIQGTMVSVERPTGGHPPNFRIRSEKDHPLKQKTVNTVFNTLKESSKKGILFRRRHIHVLQMELN